MSRTTRATAVLLCCVLFACIAGRAIPAAAGERGVVGMGDFLGEGIDFKGGMLDWEEDDEGRRVAVLRNYAVVILPQLTVQARNMVLNLELQELYAEGDVLFEETNGNSFYCDQITFNYSEWTGLAKNIKVKMDRQGVELPVRDFLDDTPSTSLSNAGGMGSINSTSDVAPGAVRRMYVQATELRAHDRYTFELIDAQISPSSFARPHWYFGSPAALLRRTEKIESYHNTVRVGRVPLLYFPYLIRDLQYDWPWMRASGGYSSNYGVYLRTQWGWQPNIRESSYIQTDKIILDLDYFTRRGVGIGLETTYKAGPLESLGKLKVYGVYEFAISDSRDLDRALNKNQDRIYRRYGNWEPSLYKDDFRWAVEWEHYQRFNEFWDVRAELNLYHDRDYLRDYDIAKYWNAKEPTNSIDIRRMNRTWELEFVAQARLANKWQTTPEYYPEMRFTLPGMQIGELPLFLKNDFRMGLVNRRFDEDEYFYTRNNANGFFALDDYGLPTSRLYDRDNYGTFFRAFNEMRLEAPIKVADIFTIKPWVGLRTAYYGDTVGTPFSHDEIMSWNTPGNPRLQDYEAYNRGYFTPGQMRKKGSAETYWAVPFGAELSTRTYTIFGAHDQWRLINEPIISYLENTKPSLDYEREVLPVDRFDEYYRQRRFGFELHSKLQRRYFENSTNDNIPQRDVLDFNIGLFYYPKERDQNTVNHGSKYSEISTDIIFRPTNRLSLSASADIDVDDGTFNRANMSVNWRLSNLFRVVVSHYHYRGHYWKFPDARQSSQTHIAVRTKLWNDNSRYSLEAAAGYEWRDTSDPNTSRYGRRHGFNRYRVTLFRDLDTFELALSYVDDRNDDNKGVFFSLAPKSFMAYDRPPPTYSAVVETLPDGRYADSTSYLGRGYLIDTPVMDADLKDLQF
ncbi:MAG: hypothetical protein LIP23_02905 [Planctomycetes bacterium]|nr:hypothetical protein [Planctomycetota bacterium]